MLRILEWAKLITVESTHITVNIHNALLPILGVYYLVNPKKLLQIHLSDISKSLIIHMLTGALCIVVMKQLESKHDNLEQVAPAGTVTALVKDFTFWDKFTVIAEDTLFIINFIYPCHWLRMITSGAFGYLHYGGPYSLTACIFKAISSYLTLCIHRSLIGVNLHHFLIDYLIITAAQNGT